MADPATGRTAEYSRRARARKRGEYVEPWPSRKLQAELGQRFGKLTVIRELPGQPRRVECACDCGTVKPILISNLVRASRSCGCAIRDVLTARNKTPAHRTLVTTHGLSQHPLWGTWKGMMARCYDIEHVAYHNYGGRGITVCPAWHDVTAYIGWIAEHLGERPAGCTLDRIDNDRDYEPGNLRWATRSTQSRNQRDAGRARGSRKTQSVLTEDIVRECRARFAAGETQHALAAEYQVSVPTMHKAITGKTWQHA